VCASPAGERGAAGAPKAGGGGGEEMGGVEGEGELGKRKRAGG